MPGSHGSLTKAGKVRSQTPRTPPRERKKLVPRIRNLRNYEKRLILGRSPGQVIAE